MPVRYPKDQAEILMPNYFVLGKGSSKASETPSPPKKPAYSKEELLRVGIPEHLHSVVPMYDNLADVVADLSAKKTS